MSNQDFKTCQEAFHACRDQYTKHAFELDRDFSKWSLGIGAGAIGLSLTFLKDIVGSHETSASGLLWASWITLGIAILTVLINLACGLNAHERFRDILDEEAQRNLDGALFVRAHKRQMEVRWYRWIDYLRGSVLLLILVGVTCLLWFAAVNVFGQKGPANAGKELPQVTATVESGKATASVATQDGVATATISPTGAATATVSRPRQADDRAAPEGGAQQSGPDGRGSAP